MPANTEAGKAVRNIQEDGRESLSDPNLVRQYGSSATPYGREVIDHLAFSEQDKQACGVRDDEVLVFPARNEATGWQGKRRLSQVRHKYGEARHVLFVEGSRKGQDPFEHSHNMAVAVPREAWEREEAKRQARGEAHIAQFHPVDEDGNVFEREVDVFEKTTENYRNRARQNRKMFREMGVGEGGPTAHMSFEQGLEYYERRGIDLDAREARIRRGGAHSEENTERFRQILRGDKKQFTSGFGKAVNPNSALGQIQQKNARAQSAR
jgi:hypothetical protein